MASGAPNLSFMQIRHSQSVWLSCQRNESSARTIFGAIRRSTRRPRGRRHDERRRKLDDERIKCFSIPSCHVRHPRSVQLYTLDIASTRSSERDESRAKILHNSLGATQRKLA